LAGALTHVTEQRHIVCFGELLIRLSSADGEMLLQRPSLDTHVGGAEANVAVSLARFGNTVRMVSIVPPNALGSAAVGELQRHGVDTAGIARRPGRMGLYFVTPGAVTRPTAVLYDRARSAFALAASSAIDWPRTLEQASWLHLSGVTSALGELAAAANQRAAEAAAALGVAVSFDGNYREQLWTENGGNAPELLRRILAVARVAFIDDRDVALILGTEFAQADAVERRRAAAAAAFAALPQLERICSTIRTVTDARHHELSAVMFTRTRELRSRTHSLDGIVDRVGAGDAFTAGILHGLAAGRDEQSVLEFAAAAAALKHSVRGDFNVVDAADVERLLGATSLDIRR